MFKVFKSTQSRENSLESKTNSPRDFLKHDMLRGPYDIEYHGITEVKFFQK